VRFTTVRVTIVQTQIWIQNREILYESTILISSILLDRAARQFSASKWRRRIKKEVQSFD